MLDCECMETGECSCEDSEVACMCVCECIECEDYNSYICECGGNCQCNNDYMEEIKLWIRWV